MKWPIICVVSIVLTAATFVGGGVILYQSISAENSTGANVGKPSLEKIFNIGNFKPEWIWK